MLKNLENLDPENLTLDLTQNQDLTLDPEKPNQDPEKPNQDLENLKVNPDLEKPNQDLENPKVNQDQEKPNQDHVPHPEEPKQNVL